MWVFIFFIVALQSSKNLCFYVILVGKQAYALALALFHAHNTKGNDFFQC